MNGLEQGTNKTLDSVRHASFIPERSQEHIDIVKLLPRYEHLNTICAYIRQK